MNNSTKKVDFKCTKALSESSYLNKYYLIFRNKIKYRLFYRYEIKSIRTASFMRGILLSFIMYSTRMSIFVSILAYVLLGNYITAEKVFVLTSFYNILRQTMTVFFPQGISQIAEARVSIGRLNKFLLYDETQIAKSKRNLEMAKSENKQNETQRSLNGIDSKQELGVYLTNATAKWTEHSVDNTLTNLNIKVRIIKYLDESNIYRTKNK